MKILTILELLMCMLRLHISQKMVQFETAGQFKEIYFMKDIMNLPATTTTHSPIEICWIFRFKSILRFSVMPSVCRRDSRVVCPWMRSLPLYERRWKLLLVSMNLFRSSFNFFLLPLSSDVFSAISFRIWSDNKEYY